MAVPCQAITLVDQGRQAAVQTTNAKVFIQKGPGNFQGCDTAFQDLLKQKCYEKHININFTNNASTESEKPQFDFVLLLCVNVSRITSDVRHALTTLPEHIKGIDVILVVFHYVASHTSSSVDPTRDRLDDGELKQAFKCITDVIYWEGNLNKYVAEDAINDILEENRWHENISRHNLQTSQEPPTKASKNEQPNSQSIPKQMMQAFSHFKEDVIKGIKGKQRNTVQTDNTRAGGTSQLSSSPIQKPCAKPQAQPKIQSRHQFAEVHYLTGIGEFQGCDKTFIDSIKRHLMTQHKINLGIMNLSLDKDSQFSKNSVLHLLFCIPIAGFNSSVNQALHLYQNFKYKYGVFAPLVLVIFNYKAPHTDHKCYSSDLIENAIARDFYKVFDVCFFEGKLSDETDAVNNITEIIGQELGLWKEARICFVVLGATMDKDKQDIKVSFLEELLLRGIGRGRSLLVYDPDYGYSYRAEDMDIATLILSIATLKNDNFDENISEIMESLYCRPFILVTIKEHGECLQKLEKYENNLKIFEVKKRGLSLEGVDAVLEHLIHLCHSKSLK